LLDSSAGVRLRSAEEKMLDLASKDNGSASSRSSSADTSCTVMEGCMNKCADHPGDILLLQQLLQAEQCKHAAEMAEIRKNQMAQQTVINEVVKQLIGIQTEQQKKDRDRHEHDANFSSETGESDAQTLLASNMLNTLEVFIAELCQNHFVVALEACMTEARQQSITAEEDMRQHDHLQKTELCGEALRKLEALHNSVADGKGSSPPPSPLQGLAYPASVCDLRLDAGIDTYPTSGRRANDIDLGDRPRTIFVNPTISSLPPSLADGCALRWLPLVTAMKDLSTDCHSSYEQLQEYGMMQQEA